MDSAAGQWCKVQVAVIAITGNGAALGQKLCSGLAGCELLVSRRYAGRAGKRCRTFEPEALSDVISDAWKQYSGFVMIMAAGIVVRMVAPLLESKQSDPAVVVMDDAGRFAVSLLSGHLGGANELAERCAFVTGARAVITTATDANSLPSFDLLARDMGWLIDDISRVKLLNRLLLDNQEIAVVDPTGQVRAWFHGRGRLSFHDTMAAAADSKAAGVLWVSNRQIPPQAVPETCLLLRPCNLTLGIGCNRGAAADEIEMLVAAHLKRALLSPQSIACIASADVKREEAGLLEYAGRIGRPIRFFSSEELNSVSVPSPVSEHAMAAIGAAGVAEPAAILASGGGNLLLKKVKSENVTLAVAEMGA